VKHGQVFVRGVRADGTFGNIDALNLDDASFRAFVLDVLFRAGAVVGIKDEETRGEHITYRERDALREFLGIR
jgi:hypothetical protein